jgi:ATP-dependent RNA helicase DeaD
MEEFKKLGLSEETVKILKKKGFTEPTSIQARVIPLLLQEKKDVVGQSQTGTGKTASFALPIIEKIEPNSKTVQAIVLTPTRELAIQVSKEISSLNSKRGLKVLAVYGGAAIGPQRDQLRKGVDIVVGTPGRIMDLQKRKSLKLDHIKYAVLDEADEMLNMGFVEDIEKILQNTPKDKTVLLFSATMPKQILKIAQKYMREYDFIETEKTQVITTNVEQIYYDISARDRVEGLRRIIDSNLDFYGIIFCRTKANVDTLAQQLTGLNYSAAALHGDITQGQREKILQQFRNKHIKILVATDVAARGIDVNDLTHVVNFSLPQSPELYVHRIGRTGRAGKKGISITLVIPSEKRGLRFVERINKCKITRHELPTSKEIIQNKENQIKEMIEEIIKNKDKSSKYDDIAEGLLADHPPKEVISAVLKYSLKQDLNATYKSISEPKAARERPPSNRNRRRPNQRSDRQGFKKKTFGKKPRFPKNNSSKNKKPNFRPKKKKT